VTDPAVRLVLDTSAVLAYTGGSIDLGETIAEVVDEGGWFGASTVCLAEASRLVADDQRPRLLLLATHYRFMVLPALAEDWSQLGYWARQAGRIDRGAAVVEALARPDGYLITAEPEAYDSDALAELPVIGI
jgi:hypothetical protein